MLRKKLTTITIIALTILFVGSCASVPIVDSEWCSDKGNYGAHCNWLKAEGKSRDISKEEWDKERFGYICTDPSTFSNWKKALKKMCDEMNICYFYQEELSQIENGLDRIADK